MECKDVFLLVLTHDTCSFTPRLGLVRQVDFFHFSSSAGRSINSSKRDLCGQARGLQYADTGGVTTPPVSGCEAKLMISQVSTSAKLCNRVCTVYRCSCVYVLVFNLIIM